MVKKTYLCFQGVTCFHLVPSLHLLATGSADGMVRLFESTQTNPFATLASPGFAAVLDVAIVPGREIVFAYSNNCVSNEIIKNIEADSSGKWKGS